MKVGFLLQNPFNFASSPKLMALIAQGLIDAPMEHLENSMVHNEDALGKVQDTDYSQAAVEQMRNSVKVQMANNIIGKSMRMNDLLIDLTTKHHRGAMLNAKA